MLQQVYIACLNKRVKYFALSYKIPCVLPRVLSTCTEFTMSRFANRWLAVEEYDVKNWSTEET
jgi:hypothetical protein